MEAFGPAARLLKALVSVRFRFVFGHYFQQLEGCDSPVLSFVLASFFQKLLFLNNFLASFLQKRILFFRDFQDFYLPEQFMPFILNGLREGLRLFEEGFVAGMALVFPPDAWPRLRRKLHI